MKRVEIFLDDSRSKLERKVEELINRSGVLLISISLSVAGRYYSVLVCYEEDEDGNV
jgi:hypothetical protein